MKFVRSVPVTAVAALAFTLSVPPVAAQQVSLSAVDSLAQLGRTDEAREILSRWIAAVEGNAPRLDLQRSFWLRAVLTVDPDQAALDLRRLVVEYPGGGWTDQALLRLGQLAVARGDLATAASQFRTLLRDHPTSPARLPARAWLEENEARVAQAEEEQPAEPAAEAEADAVPEPEPDAAPESPEPESPEPEPEAVRNAQPSAPPPTPPAEVPVSRSDVAAGVAEAERPEAVADTASPRAEPPDTLGRERLARPAPAARRGIDPTAPVTAEPRAEAAEAAGDFTIQLGAFASDERARDLLDEVLAAGFDARLVAMPDSELLRVRVGRFLDPEVATRVYDRITARGFEAAVVADAAREVDPEARSGG